MKRLLGILLVGALTFNVHTATGGDAYDELFEMCTEQNKAIHGWIKDVANIYDLIEDLPYSEQYEYKVKVEAQVKDILPHIDLFNDVCPSVDFNEISFADELLMYSL